MRKKLTYIVEKNSGILLKTWINRNIIAIAR